MSNDSKIYAAFDKWWCDYPSFNNMTARQIAYFAWIAAYLYASEKHAEEPQSMIEGMDESL